MRTLVEEVAGRHGWTLTSLEKVQGPTLAYRAKLRPGLSELVLMVIAKLLIAAFALLIIGVVIYNLCRQTGTGQDFLILIALEAAALFALTRPIIRQVNLTAQSQDCDRWHVEMEGHPVTWIAELPLALENVLATYLEAACCN